MEYNGNSQQLLYLLPFSIIRRYVKLRTRAYINFYIFTMLVLLTINYEIQC